jgi:DNA-binding transcriptional MerR regulator
MRIGELAATAAVSTKTIRYYESIGLVREPERTGSGYRDYGPAAVERLRFIREAQATGLTLAEIQSVLELKDAGAASCDHTRRLVERHLADIDAQMARLEIARAELLDLAARADALDPTTCTDPNRCQVIEGTA